MRKKKTNANVKKNRKKKNRLADICNNIMLKNFTIISAKSYVYFYHSRYVYFQRDKKNK